MSSAVPNITKASGEVVPFSREKLAASLRRSGATPEISEDIAERILSGLQPGTSTKRIYQQAFQLLRGRSRSVAGRYKLKRAIMELGPSGFPFERFIARILELDGFAVQVGRIVQGRCVDHEIDVMAEKGDHRYLVECKYHNQPGRVCDVKVPLYIHARFLDVEGEWKRLPGNGTKQYQGWVVTNTRFTGDALRYGTCAGMVMLSWDHPARNSLKARIDRSGLYPLTCLGSLTKAEKLRLLENGVVLCQEIIQDPAVLEQAEVPRRRMQSVLHECAALCERLNGRQKP